MPEPPELAAYRDVLRLIPLLGEAAAFLDLTRRELMFIRNGQVPVPVAYDAAAVASLERSQGAALLTIFSEDVHYEQKLAILADAVVSLVSARPQGERFAFLVGNSPRSWISSEPATGCSPRSSPTRRSAATSRMPASTT